MSRLKSEKSSKIERVRRQMKCERLIEIENQLFISTTLTACSKGEDVRRGPIDVVTSRFVSWILKFSWKEKNDIQFILVGLLTRTPSIGSQQLPTLNNVIVSELVVEREDTADWALWSCDLRLDSWGHFSCCASERIPSSRVRWEHYEEQNVME